MPDRARGDKPPRRECSAVRCLRVTAKVQYVGDSRSTPRSTLPQALVPVDGWSLDVAVIIGTVALPGNEVVNGHTARHARPGSGKRRRSSTQHPLTASAAGQGPGEFSPSPLLSLSWPLRRRPALKSPDTRHAGLCWSLPPTFYFQIRDQKRDLTSARYSRHPTATASRKSPTASLGGELPSSTASGTNFANNSFLWGANSRIPIAGTENPPPRLCYVIYPSTASPISKSRGRLSYWKLTLRPRILAARFVRGGG